MINARRRLWTLFGRPPLLGRIAVLALATALLAGACGSTTQSLGPTIQLRPSGSPGSSGSAGPSAAPTLAPSSPALPSATVGSSTAASASPAASSSARPSVGGATTSPSETATGSAAAGSLDWTDCGAPFECATLMVPLDYKNPGARSISLALIRLPASDASARIGSLLTNPGGPGASGVDFVRSAGESLYSQALRSRFDIVGFDPRGAGASTPIECVDGVTEDRLLNLDPILDDPAEKQAYIDGTKEFDQACQANSGDLLPFMTTADAARDMDQIRIALGEPKLTYLGFSYGTFLGSMYAGLFPDHVRALALDGAVDQTVGLIDANEQQTVSFENALNHFFDDCAARAACTFHNGGHPAQAFDAVMAKIDKTPLPALAIGDSRMVGPGLAYTAVFSALYAREAWDALAQGLALAQLGDGSILLLLADAYTERQPDGRYKNLFAANNAVNCSDYTVPTDIAFYDALVAKYVKLAPRLGRPSAYNDLSCALWPIHAAHDPAPITADGAPPILVIGTTGDPATPYQWAVNLAKQLKSGVLLTRTGEGHTAYGESQCIVAAVDAYLIDLTVPAPNTTCAT